MSYIYYSIYRLRVELLETKNGEITPAHFHVFFTDHKMLVLPLFLVQKRLRDAFLGQKFWKDMSERSVILSPKRKVSLADIMVAVSCCCSIIFYATTTYNHYLYPYHCYRRKTE